MKDFKPLVALALFVALLAGAMYLVNRDKGFGGSGSRSGSSADQLAELLAAQQQILKRLDRLESAPGLARGTAVPSGFPGRSAGAGLSNGPGATMSAAQIAAAQSTSIRERDSKFADEPLDAAWAAGNERRISGLLSAKSLKAEQATAPKNLEAKCHSQTCRISMSFDDELQADFTKVVFLEQLGARLPRAEIFQQRMPDGTTRYLVYAQSSGSNGR